MASYAFSPLFNFRSKIDLISLEKNLTLKKVSKEDREVLLDSFLTPFSDYNIPTSLSAVAGAIATCEYALILKGESKHADAEFQLSSYSVIESLLSSMRLFKEGRVTAGCTLFSHEAEPKYYPYFARLILPLEHGPPYVLLESEVNDFVEFWKKYKNFDVSKGRLSVAVRRFNLSYDMSLLSEDKLIDYIIAFEALYLHKDIKDKGENLALKASDSIGEDKDQKEEIYNALRQAYRERNSIMHGEKIEDAVDVAGKDVSLDDFILLIEEYLRRSIKKHLDLPVSYERNRWKLENLRLRRLAFKGKLSRVGYFNGACPICESHIGIDVFVDHRNKKHSWCASCRREIFNDIDHEKIV